MGAEGEREDEEQKGRESVWQTDSRVGVALEQVFRWLGAAGLARAGAACRAWRRAAARSAAWRRLLRERCSGGGDGDAGLRALRALASVYEGGCPWREVFASAAAPWRRTARLAPTPRARLAAAALHRAGDLLVLAADDCSFTVWVPEAGRERAQWRQAGAGSVAALGWRGVARAEWAPRGRRLLLAGAAPLASQRGELAVLRPATEGSLSAWQVAARAGGAGGCWAGDAFLSLELARLSAPHHAPHFATDVWLNAATQETQSEFAGVAAPVLRVYNEARALITQAVCADAPLDARGAREWAEAEAAAAAEDAGLAPPPPPEELDEQALDEAYYTAIYDRTEDTDTDTDLEPQVRTQTAWVRVVVLACGGVLGAWPLPRAAPPPLRVPGALADRVRARAMRRRQEAEAAAAVAAGEVEEAAPALEPAAAELRARCSPPAARRRLPGAVLGLAALHNGRAVWACVAGGALCCALPALRVLRVLRAPAGPAAPHYLLPHARQEFFGSPCGGGSGCALVWGPAVGAGARLGESSGGEGGEGGAALAVLLPHAAPCAPPTALLITEDELAVWQCAAPRAPTPGAHGDSCSDCSHSDCCCSHCSHSDDDCGATCNTSSASSTN